MFRPYKVIIRPSKKTCKHLGSHNAVKHNTALGCFLGGPEDDLIKVETCCPDKYTVLLYI